ncbi:MAG: hypothetical protein K2Y23_14070 [Cyanobacteria bacterium]|nr:hypothetical protein [Cyanobacteriota bacterium]
MKLQPGLLAAALLTLAVAGCSHGTISEIPTAPTQTPAVTIAALTVTPVGGGTMIEGLTAPITSSGGFPATGAALGAFAQYTDGSGKYVEATWTSSDSGVIAIEGGNFIARGRGTAIVTAAAEGKTDSETFVVQPGIAGTWSGTLLVEQCAADTGSMSEVVCYPPNQGRTPGVLAVGAQPPMTLQITKSGTDLRAAVQFGDLRGTLTGTDRGQNFLTLTGDLTSSATTMKVVIFDARVREDVMEGAIGVEVRNTSLPGHAQVALRINTVTRR